MLNIVILVFNYIYKNIIEIIFPEFCIGCNKINTLLCNNCYQTLEFYQFKIDSEEKTPNLKSVTCCCDHQGLAKKIIYELKYKTVINVGKLIAHLIYYNSSLPNFDLITFVPMYKKKENNRGFNQSKIIAVELGKIVNKPVANLLIKTKNTKSQMSLNKKTSRKNNLLNTIKINPKVDKKIIIEYKNILIIDDVFTSGITVNYCAKVLKNFGFKNIHAACFSHQN